MSTGAHGNRPTRNQQREAARAKAKELREQQNKNDKRRKLFLQGGIGLAVVAIAAIFTLTIATSAPKEGPRPANMASDGIVLSGAGMAGVLSEAGSPGADPVANMPMPGSSTVSIEVYQDYLCPACTLSRFRPLLKQALPLSKFTPLACWQTSPLEPSTRFALPLQQRV
jgi:protein-disulfide isomerase